MSWLTTLAALAAAIPVVYWSISWLALRWAYAHFTVLDDIKALGVVRKDGRTVARTAVVCGGSIAGLLAARVCATHFEEVIVIDPDNDKLLEDTKSYQVDGKDPTRPRVMQWDSYHAGQPIYFAGLKKLFPTFEAELARVNAREASADYNAHLGGIRLPFPVAHFPDEGRTRYGLTRVANEIAIRRMLLPYRNVRFVSGTVRGFEVDPKDPKFIHAVQYRPRGEDARAVSQEASLVLDCSGATQAGLSWLRKANFLPSNTSELVERYDPKLASVTCYFTIDPTVLEKLHPSTYDAKSAFMGFFLPALLIERRFLMIEKQENNQLVMMCGGFGFSATIENVADIRTFVSSLKQLAPPPAWVNDLLDYLEGDPAKTARYVRTSGKALSYVHYDAVKDSLPGNFVALGDAVMVINPFMGQGLGKTIVEATVLDTILRAIPAGQDKIPASTCKAFFRRSTAVTKHQWTSAKYSDYGSSSCEPVEGETLSEGENMRKFVAAFAKRMLKGDRDMGRRFMSIRFWMGPPTLIMGPSAVLKVSKDLIMG